MVKYSLQNGILFQKLPIDYSLVLVKEKIENAILKTQRKHRVMKYRNTTVLVRCPECRSHFYAGKKSILKNRTCPSCSKVVTFAVVKPAPKINGKNSLQKG